MTPVVIDTVLAAAAVGLAIAAANGKCTVKIGDSVSTSTEDCLGLNYVVSGMFGLAAVPWASSALYGYVRVHEQEKYDTPAPIARQDDPDAAPPIAPPGLTLTCEQRRDAILAAAQAAASDEMHAVTVRDLPQCDAGNAANH